MNNPIGQPVSHVIINDLITGDDIQALRQSGNHLLVQLKGAAWGREPRPERGDRAGVPGREDGGAEGHDNLHQGRVQLPRR